jgi:drug/metabolite transporter (DMT)-like permease
MSLASHLGAILCATFIAIGQVLFKQAAIGMKTESFGLGSQALWVLAAALAIYGIATILWVIILQNAPLGRLYPYMALSFVLVALASAAIFHESLTVGYAAGLALIVAGLVVIATV